MPSDARVTIGLETFNALMRSDVSPASCEQLRKLVPYNGQIIHARWSGEACWSPLSDVWPLGTQLTEKNAASNPQPGEILLYAGGVSEPELLVSYGQCQFASKEGPLAGSIVLTICDDLDRLAAVGHKILWHGAMNFLIELDSCAQHLPEANSGKGGLE